MLKRLFNLSICLFILNLCWLSHAWSAELGSDFYLDKTRVVAEQVNLLKNRAQQKEIELANLQRQQSAQTNLSYDHISKQWLNWTNLDIAIAKSNLDSINIELAESQQTISLLTKDTQEIDNQVNVFNIFGVKNANKSVPNINSMRSLLAYQQNVLQLEKTRADYLIKLQKFSETILQIYNARYTKIENLLKSQTMMQLKDRQSKYEIDYQQQQEVWLTHLNSLYADLKKLEQSKTKNKAAYLKLDNEIFYASENMNFMYLKMLTARYQDQIQQFKVSISHSSSITLLNKVSEQIQVLNKQFIRLDDLLNARVDILAKRKLFISQQKTANADYLAQLVDLENQYRSEKNDLTVLRYELNTFKQTLEQALQHELSARQGLLGFGAKAWLDLGNEILLVPTLTLQIFKSLAATLFKIVAVASYGWWLCIVLLEIIWISLFSFAHRFLSRFVLGIPDHELGHISLRWLSIKVLNRILLDIALLGNIYWFLSFCQIPVQNFKFIINLGLVWICFKAFITIARLSLVETMHDRAGHDVRLYYRLKWTFIIGGIITAFTVLLHQLPLIYEVKDLFYRLFLLFLAIVSLFLLKSWDVVPGLILPHIDEHRTYLRNVVRLWCILIPVVLLSNSIIGLFGFINFVLSISWYESIFLVVLIVYLLLRGLLREGMEWGSHLLIRHVTNGWLWTEAFLKPIDKVLRIILFLMAWVTLFFFYGWDRESPVVERLDTLFHYSIGTMLNTNVTAITIIELAVIISLLYWLARWTREFVYRFLLTRTKDLGVRNSIAILSQYTMIVIGFLIGLKVLGIDFRALTVVAGAFAFGVGLGLRDLANNFVCGFLLLFERPLRVGDLVTLSGYEGEVMHIGGRAVTVRTWDHMEVLVPNAEIFSKTFINWTAKDHVVRTVVAIKIHRLDGPHNVQALIYQALANHKNVLKDPSPEVFLKELADELIEFEVRYFVNLRQVSSRIGVRSEVLLAIWEIFEKNGIKPPYLHHEVLIKGNVPPLLEAPGT